jgi:molybdate-binding protein/DNA-binding transcriptional regulator YhcF (GntR family)
MADSHPEFRLHPSGDMPLYRQIADQIRRQIAGGQLVPGDALPTVRGLSDDLGCNPSTVSRAYTELSRDGLIVGRRGGGTYVADTDQPRNPRLRQAQLVNLIERALLEALTAGFSPSEVEAGFTIALSRWREVTSGEATGPGPARKPDRLTFVGSHDAAVELLATQLRSTAPSVDLTLQFDGSLGGLMALARGEADIAGAHLRDAASGEYNVGYVRHILPGRPITLVTLATRSIGLIVAHGNPKAVQSIQDLGRPDVTLVNRQIGSGTRVLLDARLREIGIAPSSVHGYDREVRTHLAVAEAIDQHRADVGLGVRAAAAALGLDFTPLHRERYDLVMLRDTWQHPPVQSLLSSLRSTAFRCAVEALGGYDVSDMGRTIQLDL